MSLHVLSVFKFAICRTFKLNGLVMSSYSELKQRDSVLICFPVIILHLKVCDDGTLLKQETS
jgi:hypothetical protein